MESTLPIVLALLLASTGFAQVKTTITPSGSLTQDAPFFAMHFGSLPEFRYQFSHPALRGRGPKLVTKVGYRREAGDFAGPFAPVPSGRTWSKVTLECAESKVAALSNIFSLNALSTPQRVFSGAVTWPAQPGVPAKNPAPFEASLSFPFSRAWSYSGVNDAMLDYRFVGGSLATLMPWVSNVMYLLDAPRAGAYVSGRNERFGTKGPMACTDSLMRLPAYANLTVHVYCKTGNQAALNDKLTFGLTSYGTATYSTVVHALDFAGSPVGVPFQSIGCNKLHLAATSSMMLFFHSTSQASWKTTRIGPIPFKSFYKGTTLWAQALWNDSASKQAKLSRATRMTIPGQIAQPLLSVVVLGAAIGNTGFVFGSDPSFNPVVGWTH